MKKVGNIVRIALIIVVIALIFMNLKNGFEVNVNYSEMISAIKQEKVKKMKISADKTYVKYVYNDKNANLIRKFKPSKHKFTNSIYKFVL